MVCGRFRRIRPVEHVEQRRKNRKDEDAGLGSARTTGEPCGSVEVYVEQMTFERLSALQVFGSAKTTISV